MRNDRGPQEVLPASLGEEAWVDRDGYCGEGRRWQVAIAMGSDEECDAVGTGLTDWTVWSPSAVTIASGRSSTTGEMVMAGTGPEQRRKRGSSPEMMGRIKARKKSDAGSP
ncbi:hypothetical protein L1887_18037 [Cichorium endivia]|nr:hypothetical protein L1887_18037 [Cichorium endivia]